MMSKNRLFAAMIDCSRDGVMTIEEAKKFALTIKSFSYNALLLYTEDTYEINGEPFFGYKRGRYSEEELKSLDDYCSSIGIELIPCIQTLAHLSQIFRYDEYSQINDTGDILLADDERTYALIEKMIGSCRRSFRSHRIHIGMDEAPMVGRGRHETIHGAQPQVEVLLRHLQRVASLAAQYDFRPMMWGDMFYRLINNGDYYGSNTKLDPNVSKKIPDNVDIVYWDYYHEKKEDYDSMIVSGQQLFKTLVFAGGVWAWEGFAPMNRFSLKCMESAFRSCHEHNVKDVIVTAWGDDGRECSPFAVLPSFYACHRFYEGENNLKTIGKEFDEITGEHFDDFLELDELNALGTKRYDFSNPVKWGFYNDPFLGLYDPYIQKDGAKEYAKLVERYEASAKRSKDFAYIFLEASALARFMSFKYDLGIRTREAYKSRNETTLKNVLSQYEEATTSLKAFYESFRILWMKEAKPFGFEIHDARIGGLIQRLTHCQRTLRDFLERKITVIEELEEGPLDMYSQDENKKKEGISFNLWSGIISTSRI